MTADFSANGNNIDVDEDSGYFKISSEFQMYLVVTLKVTPYDVIDSALE